ncbi:MAG: hypothetical protein DMG96_13825 [Acidobacteria bacterium]|nr:MAG: hypothetical protein DMG96_13825 [Acidobacteriota bacterium]
MCDAIHRLFILLFGRPQRIEFWILGVDVIVVFLIWYEIRVEKNQRRADDHRRVVISGKMMPLSKLRDKGLRIKAAVPDEMAITDKQIVQKWISTVDSWSNETNSFLANSPLASNAFMLVDNIDHVNTLATIPGKIFEVRGESKAPYQTMSVQLENLHRIIERPEDYF